MSYTKTKIRRDIKFRAWDPYVEEMDYDCRDSLSFWNGLLVGEGDHIPMQFTGLKDKNGVEIYEGDILDFSIYIDKRPMIVEWDERGWSPLWEENNSQELPDLSTISVIGNIYENPELLK